MAEKRQKNSKGYEILVSKRADFGELLNKVAKPAKRSTTKRRPAK